MGNFCDRYNLLCTLPSFPAQVQFALSAFHLQLTCQSSCVHVALEDHLLSPVTPQFAQDPGSYTTMITKGKIII